MNIGEALGKKYGPLPGGAWLVIVFAVAFILLKRSKQKAATNTSGGGNASYSEGADKKINYTTSSNYTGYFGPGAGGSFEGTYAPGPINSYNRDNSVTGDGTTVNAPHSGAHVGVRPDHPHRHHNYTRREHGDRNWPDGAYMDHGILHDKNGEHIGGGKHR